MIGTEDKAGCAQKEQRSVQKRRTHSGIMDPALHPPEKTRSAGRYAKQEDQKVCLQIVQCHPVRKARSPDPCQTLQINTRVSQRLMGEQHPAHHHEQHSVSPGYPAGKFFQSASQKIFFPNQKYAVIKPPYRKIQRRSVPHSCKAPDNKDIAYMLSNACAVAAQGYIDVIPEPAPQGNMPSPPELSNTLDRKSVV